MSKWDGKSRGTTLGYKIFIELLKKGGIKPAYLLLRPVTLYYRLFLKSTTKPLAYLYKERLGFTDNVVRSLIKKNILTFGQTIIDKIYTLQSGNLSRIEVSREGGQYLNEMVHAGKGGLIVSAHLGNYEMAGQLLERLETKINILMYDGEDSQIKQYLDQQTGPKSFDIIYLKENLSHIYEISAALNRNELVCMHADRYVEGNRTIERPFLGKNAKFPLGPFVLASKLKAPVSFVFAMKQSKTAYKFYATAAESFEGRGNSGAERMLEKYIENLEEKVRQYPEQWFNYFDFWDDIKS